MWTDSSGAKRKRVHRDCQASSALAEHAQNSAEHVLVEQQQHRQQSTRKQAIVSALAMRGVLFGEGTCNAGMILLT